ncbi:Omp28-related outer membrane protein [Oscillatoria amoena NRMC-F 0135]|nr:Omp28-related outer membrane protein [Oscillatoria amoena NRMC-F 0135]
MKKNVLIILLMFVAGIAQAQYYYIAKKGVEAAFDPFTSTGATTVLNKPSNDVLSADQTIPFAWSFYGNPVTTYKVSDNGYITFDAAASTSVGTNTTLPDVSGPNNAIYAFWDDLELKTFTPNANATIAVKTWTYGTAPKRIHVIQWMGASPFGQPSASNFIFATVRLYEGGDFDVVNSYGYGTFTGSIGCENGDGTMGTTVSGSPNRNFGGNNGSYDAGASDVIAFYFSTATNDASIASITTPKLVNATQTTGTNIEGILANYGSTPITSLTLNYSIDGGSTISHSFSSLNITQSGGTYSFSHPTKAMFTTPGKLYNVKVWASDVNGMADDNTSNDEFTFTVFTNSGISGTKNVLIEEGTGAWCGYCPDGHLRMKDIKTQTPSVVAVMHHNGDGMTNTNSNTVNSTYATGYPYGMIDRTLFSGQTTVGQNRGLWASRVATQANVPAPLEIKITSKTFDPASRKIDFTVEVKSVDYCTGDIRIHAMVVENGIVGASNSNFNQRNYYSSAGAAAGGAGHPLYNQPDPIIGYSHEHVVRSIVSGAWGTQGVVPSLVAPNATYTQTYSYTLPAETSVTLPNETTARRSMNKADFIDLVAFVSYYDADATKRQVINATEVSLFGGYNSVESVSKNSVATNVYPNPASGLTTVDFTFDNAAEASIEVYDMLGVKVLTVKEGSFTSGQHFASFDASSLKNGLYVVQN